MRKGSTFPFQKEERLSLTMNSLGIDIGRPKQSQLQPLRRSICPIHVRATQQVRQDMGQEGFEKRQKSPVSRYLMPKAEETEESTRMLQRRAESSALSWMSVSLYVQSTWSAGLSIVVFCVACAVCGRTRASLLRPTEVWRSRTHSSCHVSLSRSRPKL